MPIYEFACHGCRRKVSIFQRSVKTATAPRCPECGGENLRRLVSAFAFHRGMTDFDDGPDFDDAMLDGVDENDPRSVARWARQMSGQMGEDLPPDFEQQIARMESGEFPEEAGGLDDGSSWDD